MLESLAPENIQILTMEILHSAGVQVLVSTDMKELIRFAAADKWEEFVVLCREVIRFGDQCEDPQWHNLGRYFSNRGNAYVTKKHDRAEAEQILKDLTTLAQHISIQTRFSPDIEELEAIQLLRKGGVRRYYKVVEKLVAVVIFIQLEITEIFFDNCLTTAGNNKPERLGVANLSLHYANVINQINDISSRPMSFPTSVRDELYQGLPNIVKVALRSRCQSYNVTEELKLPQIKAEMKKTLNWLVPVATNTIKYHLKKAHQGFGCSEYGKNGCLSKSIIRLQTLHHAEKVKVDHYILELVVWLHRLVTVARQRDCGITTLPTRTPSLRKSLHHIDTKTLRLLLEEREMLDKSVQKKRNRRLSKSQEFISLQNKGKRSFVASKSTGNSPENSPARLQRSKDEYMDIVDRLGGSIFLK